jgi:hypothetical protein
VLGDQCFGGFDVVEGVENTTVEPRYVGEAEVAADLQRDETTQVKSQCEFSETFTLNID